MKILVFDTSSTACTVGLFDGNQIKSFHKIAPRQQALLILPMIKELLETSSVKLNQLDAVAYTYGPGSFTGIRIANSIIQAIGFAIQLPIIQISSMAALAETAYLNQGWEKLMVSIDARAGLIYWATYVYNALGYIDLLGQEQVCKPEHIKIPTGTDWYGIGNGWDVYRKELLEVYKNKNIKINTLEAPTAHALIEIAKVKLERNEWVDVGNAIPAYLR